MRTFFEVLQRRDGSAALGTFVKLPARDVAPILRAGGLDFVIIDYEHSPFSVSEVAALVAAFAGETIPALVRVGDHSYADSQRLLDAGAAGIVIPHVRDAEVARAVMTPLLFPPLGSRGNGYTSRAGAWGALQGGSGEYVRRGNEDIARVPMIEDSTAVDAIDTILSTPGVNAVFVGRGDLSMSMNVPSSHPDVAAALSRVVQAARLRSIPCGTAVPDASAAADLAGTGLDFLLLSNDASMLATAARTLVGDTRRGMSVKSPVMTEVPS